jgi:hypothetical protein
MGWNVCWRHPTRIVGGTACFSDRSAARHEAGQSGKDGGRIGGRDGCVAGMQAAVRGMRRSGGGVVLGMSGRGRRW